MGCALLVAEDDRDLAVIELSQHASLEIARTHRFLTLPQCDFSPSYHPLQPFMVLGYPFVQTRFDRENRCLSIEPFPYVTGLYSADTQRIPDHPLPAYLSSAV